MKYPAFQDALQKKKEPLPKQLRPPGGLAVLYSRFPTKRFSFAHGWRRPNHSRPSHGLRVEVPLLFKRSIIQEGLGICF